MITTAFVLGAGLGTRLRPLTDQMPKPLLPVGGRPMICHAFARLAEAGVRRFIVNTHHCHEAYAIAFPNAHWNGIPIQFVHEPVLLDTGGGLKNIENLLTPNDENLFVFNGDIYAAPPLATLAAAHTATCADATLLLRSEVVGQASRLPLSSADTALLSRSELVGQASRLPLSNADTALLSRSEGAVKNVRFAADDGNFAPPCTGTVLDLRGRLGATDGIATLFTGIYCIRRSFFARLEQSKIESVVEAFLRAITATPNSIRALLDNSGSWRDLGTLKDYEDVLLHHGSIGN